MLKNYLLAMRLPFLTASLVPVLLGVSIAWNNTDSINWILFILTLLGISLLHIGTNLTNDYFDHKSNNDELNLNYSSVSGGSRFIQDGIIPAKHYLILAVIFFAAGSLIGIYIVFNIKSPVILILGMIGVFCGFFYTGLPIKMGYRGLGELIVGLCFGPLIVFGSYYVQTKNVSLHPILTSVPIAILILLVLLINEFPDYDADKQVNKNTIVVLLGKQRSIIIYHFLMASVYLYTLICFYMKIFSVYSLIVVVTLPIALKAYYVSKENYRNVDKLLEVCYLTIKLHLSFGLLLSLSFILQKLF